MINYPVQQQGAALLIFVLLFVVGSTALIATLQHAILSDLTTARQLVNVKQAFFASESGLEDVAFRLQAGVTVDAETVTSMGGVTATTTATFDTVENRYEVMAASAAQGQHRHTTLLLYVGSGASFNFGVQSGNGGFHMANGSSVRGNVFSNGTITKGGGTATIYGDVISAGPSGLIAEINATGTARARVVRDSSIDQDVYAYTLDGEFTGGDAYVHERIGGAVVVGDTYGHQPEEATTTLPIDDDQVESMKQDIVDNGTVIAATDPECAGGTYVIDSDTTLGQLKIECDVEFRKKGSATTITLTNSLWVAGNLDFAGGPTVVIDESVGNQTVPIIVDNESDRLTSSQVSIKSGTTFIGSGSPKSYVLVLSQNQSAKTGGTEDAIFVGQSSAGDLLVYAGHGKVRLGNSISLKEVTGYLIELGNSAEVIYESGLVNLLFTSGPGGGFTISEWREVQ